MDVGLVCRMWMGIWQAETSYNVCVIVKTIIFWVTMLQWCFGVGGMSNGFESKKLNEIEQRYSTYKKKMRSTIHYLGV